MTAGIGMALVDGAGRVVVANERLCVILRYASDALTGARLPDLVHGGDLRGTSPERRMRRADGSWLWTRMTRAPLAGDGEIVTVDDIDEARRASDVLKRSELLHRAVARNLPNAAVLVFDRELRYVVADGAKVLEAAGHRDLVGKRLGDVVQSDNAAKVEAAYRAALAGEVRDIEWRRGGRTYSMHVVPVRDDAATIVAGMALVYDVSAHKRIERRLREACARLDHAIGATADAMWSIDLQQHLVSFNPAYRELHEWLFRRSPSVGEEDHDDARRGEWEDVYARALRGETFSVVREYERGGEARVLVLQLTPLKSGDRVCGVDVSSRDITAAQKTEAASRSDDLTGLQNRRGFVASAQRLLQQTRARGEESLLFFIDLDGMKAINDGLGHEAGDAALRETAELLRRVFREGDALARLGGDEFVVLARCDREHAGAIEARLRDRLAALNAEPARAYKLALSVGVCSCDADDERAIDDVVKEADAKMYEQKRARRANRSSSARRRLGHVDEAR